MTHPAAMFGFDPPDIEVGDAIAIAAEHWGVTGSPHRLRGERSHNTRITGPDGAAWMLQVMSASEDPTVIDLQTCAMRHLERNAPEIPTPRVCLTVNGEAHAEVLIEGRVHLVRLVTYLPGTTFDPSQVLPDVAHRRIGGLVGRIARGLTDFSHPSAAHFMPWDISNGLIVDDAVRLDLTPPSLAALTSVDDRLHAVMATMRSLPRSTIHNDGHAGNLIRPDEGSHLVSGVIDFGDLVHTVTAADVAIIAECFAPDDPDPARVVAAVTVGYHTELALTDGEIEALPELVLARTALNVLLVEYQVRHAPHLAPGAAADLPEVVERLVRWSRIDVDEMITRVHRAIDTAIDTALDTTPVPSLETTEPAP